MQLFSKNQLRPQVVDLLAKMVVPLVGTGVLTAAEHETIFSNLRYLAKHGCPTPAILPKLITPQEVAELLSISYSQFRALEKEGAFPFKRHMVGGKTVRYLNTEIVSYMQGHEDFFRNNPKEGWRKDEKIISQQAAPRD